MTASTFLGWATVTSSHRVWFGALTHGTSKIVDGIQDHAGKRAGIQRFTKERDPSWNTMLVRLVELLFQVYSCPNKAPKGGNNRHDQNDPNACAFQDL
jgi:hypothetical protein